MAFVARKLRVVLPQASPEAAELMPIALDLDAVTDEAAGCFTAEHVIVTTVCFSHTCVDVFSDPMYAVVVSADALPALREALEAQLAEVAAAEEALARRPVDG